jgi:hypothetical protein
VIIERMRPWTLEVADGTPGCSASTAAAIASLSVEAAGNWAFAFQAAPEPPVRLSTYTPAVPEYSRVSARSFRAKTGSCRGLTMRGRDAAGRPKTALTTRDDRRLSRATVVTRRETSPLGSETWSEKRLPRSGFDDTLRPFADTITLTVPRAALPVTIP